MLGDRTISFSHQEAFITSLKDINMRFNKLIHTSQPNSVYILKVNKGPLCLKYFYIIFLYQVYCNLNAKCDFLVVVAGKGPFHTQGVTPVLFFQKSSPSYSSSEKKTPSIFLTP